MEPILKINVDNRFKFFREETITIPINSLGDNLEVLKSTGESIPWQLDDLTILGRGRELSIPVSIAPKTIETFKVYSSSKKSSFETDLTLDYTRNGILVKNNVAEWTFSYLYGGALKKLTILGGTGVNLLPPGHFAGLEPSLAAQFTWFEHFNQSHSKTVCLEPVSHGPLRAIVRSIFRDIHEKVEVTLLWFFKANSGLSRTEMTIHALEEWTLPNLKFVMVLNNFHPKNFQASKPLIADQSTKPIILNSYRIFTPGWVYARNYAKETAGFLVPPQNVRNHNISLELVHQLSIFGSDNIILSATMGQPSTKESNGIKIRAGKTYGPWMFYSAATTGTSNFFKRTYQQISKPLEVSLLNNNTQSTQKNDQIRTLELQLRSTRRQMMSITSYTQDTPEILSRYRELLKKLYPSFLNLILRDVIRTEVKFGIALWHVYNEAFICKTPDEIIFLDMSLYTDPENYGKIDSHLLKEVDYVYASHEHSDHLSIPFLTEFFASNNKARLFGTATMIENARFKGIPKNRTVVLQPETETPLKGSTINISKVSHCKGSALALIRTRQGFTLLHSDDAFPYIDEKTLDEIHRQYSVDILLVNVWYPFIPKLALNLDTQVVIPMHILELSHSAAHCHTYSQAEWIRRNTPPIIRDRFTVLKPGDKLIYPIKEKLKH